ncbi:argininosuccinate lyase, partial [Faecalibaculum rodentium]
ISWCSWEFKFIELDDAFSTGSSIMPQKKNPDICELVRGKTGRVYGDLMTLLTVMKGLPLAYDKDMQEDKECVFDAIDTVSMCLKVLPDMLSTMTVLTENMAAAGRRGFINATDCADYLTKKGMPFRDAYKLTGGLVARCIREGRTLEQLSLEELQEESPLFDEGFYAAVDLLNAVKRRNTWGGPSPEQTQEQIAQAREFVKNHRKQD